MKHKKKKFYQTKIVNLQEEISDSDYKNKEEEISL